MTACNLFQEDVVTVTLNKYRKTHQLLEECERCGHTEAGPSLGGARTSQRNSMSVVREVTRVVRI